MKLKDLIQGMHYLNLQGDMEADVASVAFSSREVKSGGLFIAIPGLITDGHKYIGDALAAGATVVVCENLPGEPSGDVTWIQVEHSRKALSQIACNWFGNPSKEIKLVGVTGTNGKTTVATLLYKVNTGLGYKAGILSTIEVIINGETYPATHTTPDPLQINKWLRLMVEKGCEYCFMEVSSHAVSQDRIDGLHFTAGIFTNLTHDHLDYHKDFRSYLEAKKMFFDQLPKEAFALTNADDRNGAVMLQNTKAGKHNYSLKSSSDYHGKVMEVHFEGMRLQINGEEVWVRLTGRFNALNLLAVYGTCILLGHDKLQVLEQLSKASAAEGRFEIVRGKQGAVAIIDYAHTDDALRNVLESIRDINTTGKKVITVVGAGGDRDKSKRKKMGAVAAELSDTVVLTSDNPRSEDPSLIMEEMESGISAERQQQVLKIKEREEAIKTALMLAGVDALVLIAGKGHEKYQEVKGRKLHFDDKEIVKKYIK